MDAGMEDIHSLNLKFKLALALEWCRHSVTFLRFLDFAALAFCFENFDSAAASKTTEKVGIF